MLMREEAGEVEGVSSLGNGAGMWCLAEREHQENDQVDRRLDDLRSYDCKTTSTAV